MLHRDDRVPVEDARQSWRALALLKALQDGDDVTDDLRELQAQDLGPNAAAVVGVLAIVRSGEPTGTAARATLERVRVRVADGGLPEALALVDAAIVLTYPVTDPAGAVAAFARARSELPTAPDPASLPGRLTYHALNVLAVFCTRTGLLDEAFELTALALPLEDGAPAGLDGGTAALNRACTLVELALAPRTTYDDVDLDALVRARTLFEQLREDPRMKGARHDAVLVGLAVHEAWSGDAEVAWTMLPRAIRSWQSPFGPPGFWVAAATRAVRRQLEAGAEVAAVADRVEEVRTAFAWLLRHPVVAVNLEVVVCTEVLELERLLAERTGDGSRALVVLITRDELLGRLLAQARGALASALAGHTSTMSLSRANHELRRRVQVDALTGAGTRYHLERVLDGWDDAPPPRVGVVIADLDGFKQVNDVFGHLVGDEVLRQVGRLLSGAVREGDQLFRYGGDEFVVLLPGADAAAATECARRCQRVVAEHDWDSVHPGLAVTLTAGAHASDATARQLLGTADARLRGFKRGGPPATRPAPPGTG